MSNLPKKLMQKTTEAILWAIGILNVLYALNKIFTIVQGGDSSAYEIWTSLGTGYVSICIARNYGREMEYVSGGGSICIHFLRA